MTLVKALSRSSTTDAEREIVWKIVQDNFSVLKTTMGTSGMLNKLLKVVLAGFSSTIYIAKIKEFFERCPYPEANQALLEGAFQMVKKASSISNAGERRTKMACRLRSCF